MTTQKPSRSLKSIAAVALIALGVVIVLVSLEQIAAQLGNLLAITMGVALRLLPCVLLTASQSLLTLAFDCQAFLPGPLPMLVSFWPLHLMVGAVVCQGCFTDKVKALAQPKKNAENTIQRVDSAAPRSSRK